ncbi:MAG: nitrilase-related carbon-nitrogen hydrolase [Cloacibacillus sp.]
MKASLIQLKMNKDEGREALLSRVMAMVDSCAGSDLIVLPELWHAGILSYETIYDIAESKYGALMTLVSEKAKELKAFIHCGSFVNRIGDKLFNTSILFDRNGNDVAEYRKIHLFSCIGRESVMFSHGDKIVVAETELGKIGLAICYDARFPELFRQMTCEYGAEIFIVPAAWNSLRGNAFRMLNRVRAMENSAVLLSCNLTGPYKSLQMAGSSAVLDTWGEPLAALEEEEEILHAKFCVEDIRRMRADFPVFNDIRLLRKPDFARSN